MKIVGIDLDGTLLGEGTIISEYDRKTLELLNYKGVIIIIVSGRHKNEVDLILDNNRIRIPLWIVANDGLYVYNANNRLVKTFDFLHKDDLVSICKQIKHRPLLFYTQNDDYRLCPFSISSLLKSFFYCHRRCVLFPFTLRSNILIEKIALWPAKIENKLKHLQLYYTVHELNNGRVEILHNNVNKYNAIKYILDNLHFSDVDIVYFGDDENDIECFENLPYCIAMGNALQKLKSLAYYTTETNSNSGFSYAVNNLLLK